MEDLPDGVYFDLPAEKYHSLPRLSASGIKKLLVSSIDFWASSFMNPSRREFTSDALNVGTAYHTRICEGEAEFKRLYAIRPDCDRRTKEGKQIYADWLAEFPDARECTQELLDDINTTANLIEIGPMAEYFSGGKPEVSVLWHDPKTNVPMKSRFDYLKADKIVDLKTFSNSSGMDIDTTIFRSIAKFKYHVQAAVYFDAWNYLVRNPQHFGVMTDTPEFWFVFCQTGHAPLVRAKQLRKDGLIYDKGRQEMRRGIAMFRDCWEKYGKEPWYDISQPTVLRDEDMPLYVYD